MPAAQYFSQNEPDVFAPLLDVLIRKGVYYTHLADLRSDGEAHVRLSELYAEYARDIWHAEPCPVELDTSENAS